jgi:hypothetical protein
VAKPPTSSRKQAKVEQRARTTAARPPRPTRAACRAADGIRERGGLVRAEFALVPLAERAAQLPAFRARMLALCDDERRELGEAERAHDVVVAATRQMEKALTRLAIVPAPAGRRATPRSQGRSAARR